MLDTLAVHRSRTRIPALSLERPTTIDAACRILAESGDQAAICGGGIDLINRLKTGQAAGVTRLIWLSSIGELRGVRQIGDRLEIGAGTTHEALAGDPALRARYPSIAAYLGGLGNIRIRVQGTVGGNVMAGEPGYEILPLLQVLDATLHFVDPGTFGPLLVPARRFDRAMCESLRGKLLVTISFLVRPLTVRWTRQLRPVVGLVAAWEQRERGIVGGAAALAGANFEPVWSELPWDTPLSAERLMESSATLARDWASGLPAIAASAGSGTAYCRQVAPVLLRRVLSEAGQRP
ncbi:MAG TPA: FAD binding domain-containing protein [Alphaproteobacteria bacterium]